MAKRPNLLSDTLNLIKKAHKTNISYYEMCRRTGLKILWLQKVRRGTLPQPSVTKIQILHDYLKDVTEANVQ